MIPTHSIRHEGHGASQRATLLVVQHQAVGNEADAAAGFLSSDAEKPKKKKKKVKKPAEGMQRARVLLQASHLERSNTFRFCVPI